MALVGAVIGLLMLWRGPRRWFNFYLAFAFFNFMAGEVFIKPLLAYLPGLTVLNQILGPAGWQFYFILMFFFPNGKAIPGWTRWVALAWLAIIFLSLIFGDQFFLKGSGIFYALVFCAIGSQIYRYFWRSDPIQRQQTKWMMIVVVLMLTYMVGVASWAFNPPSGDDLRVALVIALANQVIFSVILSTFPLAITVAVFRYHLWDFNLVIRRTLSYGLLTFLIGLVYFGLVTLLQAIATGFSQQNSPLIVVLSTLAIATLFNPLRRRVQSAIDRRFFRQGYDAEHILNEFSAGLQNEVDIESLHNSLLGTVSKTIQPETVGLWIRKN
jgi:hypothetical protein